MWLSGRDRGVLEQARLDAFDDVMATTRGRCLRVLHDRENWYLAPGDLAAQCVKGDSPIFATMPDHASHGARVPAKTGTVPPQSPGMYLKKHRSRTWWSWLRAKLGLRACPGAGTVEAENARALAAIGIPVMRVVACGERLHGDGRLESFLLTEELAGYGELAGFLRQRISPGRELSRLVRQVAAIARRLHAAGYNHRDLNCYHFLVKERRPGEFDIRLIDLQRLQRRRWLRRRWIVKDLAQLAVSAPAECIRCREKIAFLRHYLGVRKLGPRDKRLVRSILRKQRLIQRRLGRMA
jgi:heptose I phosphotransferase